MLAAKTQGACLYYARPGAPGAAGIAGRNYRLIFKNLL
jgi:hypothetical protein